MRLLHWKHFRKLVHWGRGVNEALFYPRPRTADEWGPRPYWLNVGRVSTEKNLDAFLSLDLPGTKVVVGDGPDRPRLSAKFPQVKFLGAKHGDDLAQCYSQADVFVFPSMTDTFGLVIAEAIACGVPVAAYPTTGPIDIIEEGVTGCMRDDLGRACLKANALDRQNVARPFSWDIATDSFLSNLYPNK